MIPSFRRMVRSRVPGDATPVSGRLSIALRPGALLNPEGCVPISRVAVAG
jgi:hypothetical protein